MDTISGSGPCRDILRIVDGEDFLDELHLSDGTLSFMPVDEIGPGDACIVCG